MSALLQKIAESWVYGLLAGGFGILGFFVSWYGAHKAKKAEAAAENTQETVRNNLQLYRHHASMTEKIYTLKGARSSIVKDRITITEAGLVNVRSTAKTLLSINQALFHTETKVAVHSLYKCADEIIRLLGSDGEISKELELNFIDALDEAIVVLEEEDFNREHQKVE